MSQPTDESPRPVPEPQPARRRRWPRMLVAGLLALLVGIELAGVTYRPDLAIPPGRRGEHLSVGGTAIRYVQQGAGPNVLLIHGSPGSIEDWDSVLDELARDFRVTAYDRPGHGYSDATTKPASYAYHAQVALAVIDKLELDDVLVVGHSYGGTTALAVALEKSPRVKRIVVLDSATYQLVEPPGLLYRVLALPGFGEGVARLIGGSVAPARIRQGILSQFPSGQAPPGFVETRQTIWNQPKVTTTLAREAVRSSGELVELSRRYAQIACPLYIAAQADHPQRRAGAERLHAEVAGSELLLVKYAGHYLHWEQPQAIVELVRRAGGAGSRQAAGK